MSKLRLTALLCLFALSACGGGSTYAFPEGLPSERVIDAEYRRLHNDLSPLSVYHYRIIVPVRWKMFDTIIDLEPSPGTIGELGIFREPGEWMNDASAAFTPEISISVVMLEEDDNSTPTEWLEQKIHANTVAIKTLHKRTVSTDTGDAQDVLIRYSDDKDVLISRVAAFRAGNRIFVITGTAPEHSYKSAAPAFAAAIASFQLDEPKASNQNPFWVKE